MATLYQLLFPGRLHETLFDLGTNLSGENRILIRTFLLEKAICELGYELNGRPHQVNVPLKAFSSGDQVTSGSASMRRTTQSHVHIGRLMECKSYFSPGRG